MCTFIKRPAHFLAQLLCLLVLAIPVMASPSLPKNTNVLLITIDTLRFDRLSIISDKYVKTPHVDDLARQSAIFTKAYAHNPLTRPSHTNILTGTTPLYHGVSDNPGFKLESRYLTLAEYLRTETIGRAPSSVRLSSIPDSGWIRGSTSTMTTTANKVSANSASWNERLIA
jgi:hypothetical protein